MDLMSKTQKALSPEMSSSVHSNEPSFPILAIAIVGILATAFLLVSYYIFVIKCCLNWHRVDLLRRFSLSLSRSRSHQELLAAHSDQTHHRPSRGLDESLIRSIPVLRFEDDAKQPPGGGGGVGVSSTDCAVCLSDFRDGDRLRLIPVCSHVFHIDCIDVWLQSNDNCPLCRLSVSSAAVAASQTAVRIDVLSPPSSAAGVDAATAEEEAGEDEEKEDCLVIELTGDGGESLTGQSGPSGIFGNKPTVRGASMGDECIEIGRDNWVQPIRRSFSMDSSGDRKMFLVIQEAVRQHNIGINPNNNNNNTNNNDNNNYYNINNNYNVDQLMSLGNCSENRSVRRSFFSFTHGNRGSSRSAVLPVYLDP